MVINNVKIVTLKKVIECGHIIIEGKKIVAVKEGLYQGEEKDVIDGKGKIAMPGFIDLHIHGAAGVDVMEADEAELKKMAETLYTEGTTTFLATTLTSDQKTLKKVCRTVAKAKKDIPSLGGIHLEGPYISLKYKGAQNPDFIRDPNIEEFDELVKASHKNIRYITMAPEKENSEAFIKNAVAQGVTVSAGHSDATFKDIEKAIGCGLTNTTHTHNAMSGHHHRNPGIVTAAFYFDNLYCECICDGIHVVSDVVKTLFKVIGPDRFIIITDALKVKLSNIEKFQLFGLDAEKRDGAAYLLSGPLAGSILTMEQGVKNMAKFTGASLVDLAKISSTNAAKSAHFNDRGVIARGKLADIVLLDKDLNVIDVYKLGKKVY